MGILDFIAVLSFGLTCFGIGFLAFRYKNLTFLEESFMPRHLAHPSKYSAITILLTSIPNSDRQ